MHIVRRIGLAAILACSPPVYAQACSGGPEGGIDATGNQCDIPGDKLETAMATKVHQTPVMPMGLGSLASAAVLSIERHLRVWIAEHALAQHAAEEAALSRRQVRDIHALYIGTESPNR